MTVDKVGHDSLIIYIICVCSSIKNQHSFLIQNDTYIAITHILIIHFTCILTKYCTVVIWCFRNHFEFEDILLRLIFKIFHRHTFITLDINKCLHKGFFILIYLPVRVLFWPSISLSKASLKNWNAPDLNSKCCDTAFRKTGVVLQGKSPLIMWSIILEMLKDYIKAATLNEAENMPWRELPLLAETVSVIPC